MLKTAIATVLILTLPSMGYAHSGRTDASGCHTNRQTGDYHCHGGNDSSPSRNRPSSSPSSYPSPRRPLPQPELQPEDIIIRRAPVPAPIPQPEVKPQPSMGTASVSRILNASTVIAGNGDRQVAVRLACIEAPALDDPNSVMTLSALNQALPRTAVVTFRVLGQRDNSYMAEFLVNDQLLNLQLVAAGLAMANVADSEYCSQDYLDAEKAAYEQRLGIWRRE